MVNIVERHIARFEHRSARPDRKAVDIHVVRNVSEGFSGAANRGDGGGEAYFGT